MAEKLNYMKAVGYDQLPAAFKKKHPFDGLQAEGYWLQLKYDGCYGKAIINPDRSLCRMLSRTGEDYTASTRHILEALRQAADATMVAWAEFVILGEVWHPHWPFPTISGAFRRQASADDLVFACHDILPAEMESDTPYRDRYLELHRLLGFPKKGNIAFIVDNHRSGDWVSTPMEWALKWKAKGGYDGVVLRNPEGWYYPGTVKHGEIIKVKPILELDLRVTNSMTGRGAKTGREVVTLEVEYKGVKSWVGSGVPHDLNGPETVGKIVAIEAMGTTDDGALREPRFKGVRYDKTEPDA